MNMHSALLLSDLMCCVGHSSMFSEVVNWLPKDVHHLRMSDKMPEKMGFVV